MIGVSEKETIFHDKTYDEIKGLLIDICLENGIDIYFLLDSIQINEGIESIVNKLYYLIEKVKKDKEIIKQNELSKQLKI